MDALLKNNSAIQLKDCECIGLKISEVINGESISLELDEIFSQAGTPTAIVKDGDYTLQKGVRLWSEKQDISVPVIEDIGHVMANALKAQYIDTTGYKDFTALISKGANRLRQTDLAFLVPPKLRTKGRFQSISKLGVWGDKMLEVLAVKGAAEKGSLVARLRTALPGFSKLKPFIKSFSKTAAVTSQMMGIIKNKGLDQTSYEECLKLSKQLPKRSKVRARSIVWLDRHIAIQKEITSLPLLVSSDIIESLFGRFKHVIERSSQADMNRTALLIPALCGEIDETIIERAFSHARQKDLRSWEKDSIPYTMRKKRQVFFDGNFSHKPGNPKVA
jgi:hypothetical protein